MRVMRFIKEICGLIIAPQIEAGTDTFIVPCLAAASTPSSLATYYKLTFKRFAATASTVMTVAGQVPNIIEPEGPELPVMPSRSRICAFSKSPCCPGVPSS